MSSLVIRVDWETAEVRALMAKLQEPRLSRALSVAVNNSARQVQRFAASLIAKQLSIKLARARRGIWIMPYSRPETLTATVRGSKSQIPLKAFKAKETPAGVVASIWGQKKLYPGAFIRGGRFPARVPLQMGEHVFKRAGSRRFPIRKEAGASIAEAFVQDAITKALVAQGQERLMANIKRQLDRYSRSRGRS
ncbi:hypothetical protein [Rhodomicrobium lacus]|uniref:hypothetical protein n=1 Tax=Rhodomicrobium lacus TaxID=2498452 RepID=UPI000F8F5200|nr:hypothetical protein [Rhodomicrobium lacus]